MKWPLTIFCFCVLLIHGLATTSDAKDDKDSSGAPEWRATVSLESAPLYSGVSVSSRVVTTLKQGDAVVISMEFTSADGTWYAVSTTDQPAISGYLNARTLEVEELAADPDWEYQPPPMPIVAADVTAAENANDIVTASRGRMSGDIKPFFLSKFGRSLPVSAFGQTRLHSRLGFDHRNSVDVALSPDSAAGRALLTKLRGFGVPYIAFRKAIPGIATGAHIHVGRPSHRK
jgi:hypothetical protein